MTDRQPDTAALRAERERAIQAGEYRWPVSPEDWERAAREAMEPREFDYVAGGAGGESTVRNNRDAFERARLVPRVLSARAERDLGVEILGMRANAPLMLAPVGVLEMAHPDRELAAARAARDAGIPVVLSSQASTSMEEVANEIEDHPRWFQLYWGTDRDVVTSFVRRAEQAGYGAIVLTVDTLTQGWRERDVRNLFTPFAFGKGTAQYASDPAFRRRLEKAPEEDPPAVGIEMIRIFPNIGLRWDDLSYLRELTELPVVLKGIVHPEDAALAREHGVDGLVVSNHGGRQLDASIATLDALPEVRDAFGDGPVLLDGGVRRGVDVVKALALGADAVLIGRPYVYALAVGGQAGIAHFLATLVGDVDVTMALSGASSVGELTPGLVRFERR
jgi:lactate 2-monooxygenase